MKRYISILLFIICSSLFSNCDKNFEEINIDPTKLSGENMQYNYLFTSGQLYAAGNTNGYGAGIWESSLSYSSTMVQHLASTSSFWYGDKYIANEGYNSALWQSQYSTAVKVIVDVIENVKEDDQRANLYNMSRILKVWIFQRLTDAYGDIPYSEAGLGFSTGLTVPKYDKQQDIYTAMLQELEQAAQALNATAANTVGNADVFYGGDVAQWKKFGYSLMVRLAMRMSKVAPDDAKTWVQKAVTGGVMESNDDNAICTHEAKGTNVVSNPAGLLLRSREPTSYHLSKTLVDFLVTNDDPRLGYLGTVVADASNTADEGDSDPAHQLGMPNGHDHSGTIRDISHAPNWTGNESDYSIVNRTTFSREDAPTFFLTYAETALLLAEAAQRGWITTGTAAQWYSNGVEAAILQLNQAGAHITPAEATGYVNAHPYVAATGLQQINEQYWVATFADWIETWSNWRRSGFPQLTPVNYPGNSTGATIPRRFTYPLDEASVNPKNYSAAVSAITGGDKMASRVWWDK